MIYDGEDLSECFLMSANRPLFPSPAVTTTVVPGKDGFEVSEVRLESFSVDVECTIIPDHMAGLQERILSADEKKRYVASKLFRRKKCPLIFDSDPSRYCMAIVTDVSDVERFAYVDKCTVTFLCEPFFYSTPRTLTLTGSQTVRILGTQPTRPVVHITATATTSSIKLTNSATGEFVQVNAAFTAGAKLMIDMQARRATINGNNAAVTITSDFFALEPGNNALVLSSGTAKIEYKEVWL